METDFNKEIKRWMMLLLLHQSALRYWEGVWLVLLFWWRRRKRQSSLGFIVWGRRRSERRRRSVWWTTELLAWRTTGGWNQTGKSVLLPRNLHFHNNNSRDSSVSWSDVNMNRVLLLLWFQSNLMFHSWINWVQMQKKTQNETKTQLKRKIY